MRYSLRRLLRRERLRWGRGLLLRGASPGIRRFNFVDLWSRVGPGLGWCADLAFLDLVIGIHFGLGHTGKPLCQDLGGAGVGRPASHTRALFRDLCNHQNFFQTIEIGRWLDLDAQKRLAIMVGDGTGHCANWQSFRINLVTTTGDDLLTRLD